MRHCCPRKSIERWKAVIANQQSSGLSRVIYCAKHDIHIETVQDAQLDFVNGDSCAEYVTITDELPYLEDGWHYNTEGFIRLGAAFADAMINLEQRCGLTEWLRRY